MIDDLGLKIHSGPSTRAFGLLLGAVATLGGMWLGWKGWLGYRLVIGAGSVLIAVAIVRPAILAPLRTGWMKAAQSMASVGNVLLLTMFFFLVLTPLALILRLARRDRLAIRSPRSETYWQTTEPVSRDHTLPF